MKQLWIAALAVGVAMPVLAQSLVPQSASGQKKLDRWGISDAAWLHEPGAEIRRQSNALSRRQELEQFAARGDVRAQVILASGYFVGLWSPDDKPRALPLAREAAQSGDARALALLAQILTNSTSEAERAQARALFTRATELGSPIAMVGLSDMMASGSGGPKDAAGSMVQLRRAASLGNPIAATRVALAQLSGEGLAKDEQAAADTFERLAGAGFPDAMYYTGFAYEMGRGRPKSPETAIQWYAKGAQAGSGNAAGALAKIYTNGMIVTADNAAAYQWATKGASLGDGDSMYILGFLNEHGLGIPKDDAKAVDWYRKGSEKGSGAADLQLAVRALEGRGVPRDLAFSAQAMQRSAQGGYPEAMRRLAILKATGAGVARNDTEALDWARKAAQAGDAQGQKVADAINARMQLPADQTLGLGDDPDSLWRRGVAYANGKGVPQNMAAAILRWRPAAALGSFGAMRTLGYTLVEGDGTAPNPAEGVALLEAAGAGGDVPALRYLATLYDSGKAVTKNEARATQLHYQAAMRGNVDSMREYGLRAEGGRGGLIKNVEVANFWYRKAADAGDIDGKRFLANNLRAGNGIAKNLPEAIKLLTEAADTLGKANNIKWQVLTRMDLAYAQVQNNELAAALQTSRATQAILPNADAEIRARAQCAHGSVLLDTDPVLKSYYKLPFSEKAKYGRLPAASLEREKEYGRAYRVAVSGAKNHSDRWAARCLWDGAHAIFDTWDLSDASPDVGAYEAYQAMFAAAEKFAALGERDNAKAAFINAAYRGMMTRSPNETKEQRTVGGMRRTCNALFRGEALGLYNARAEIARENSDMLRTCIGQTWWR